MIQTLAAVNAVRVSTATAVMDVWLVSIVFQSVKNAHATMLDPCQTHVPRKLSIANAIAWDSVIVR